MQLYPLPQRVILTWMDNKVFENMAQFSNPMIHWFKLVTLFLVPTECHQFLWLICYFTENWDFYIFSVQL